MAYDSDINDYDLAESESESEGESEGESERENESMTDDEEEDEVFRRPARTFPDRPPSPPLPLSSSPTIVTRPRIFGVPLMRLRFPHPHGSLGFFPQDYGNAEMDKLAMGAKRYLDDAQHLYRRIHGHPLPRTYVPRLPDNIFQSFPVFREFLWGIPPFTLPAGFSLLDFTKYRYRVIDSGLGQSLIKKYVDLQYPMVNSGRSSWMDTTVYVHNSTVVLLFLNIDILFLLMYLEQVPIMDETRDEFDERKRNSDGFGIEPDPRYAHDDIGEESESELESGSGSGMEMDSDM